MPTLSQIFEPHAKDIRGQAMQARAEGAHIADAAVSGFSTGAAGAFNVGNTIGISVLDGILQPFGPSGSAMSRLTSTVTQGITNVFATAFDAVGALMRGGGMIAGLAVGALGGVLGVALGIAAGQVLGVVTDMFGSIVGVAAQTMGELGRVFGDGMNALVQIVQDVSGTALQSARDILQMSQRSGLGLGASLEAATNLRAFGIDPSTVPGLSQNALMQQLALGGQGVMGAPGSAEWLSTFRQQYMSRYNSGPFGPIMAGAMLGTDYAGLSGVFHQPDAAFNRQLERGATLQNAFGMTPQQILEAQQNFQGLVNTVMQGIDLLKTRVFVELMPFLTRALDGVIRYVSNNADEIVDIIKRAVRWLVTELPAGLMEFTGVALTTMGRFLQGMGDFAETLRIHLPDILGVLDNVLNGIRKFIGGGIAVYEALSDPIAFGSKLGLKARDALRGQFGGPSGTFEGGFINLDGIQSLWGGSGDKVPSGVSDALLRAAGGTGNLSMREQWLRAVPESTLRARFGQPDGALANFLGGARDFGQQRGAQLVEMGEALSARGGKWRTDKEREIAAMERIASASEATAANTASTNRLLPTMANQLQAGLLRNIVEEEWRSLSRR